jgi:hypothetical protein
MKYLCGYYKRCCLWADTEGWRWTSYRSGSKLKELRIKHHVFWIAKSGKYEQGQINYEGGNVKS